MAGDPYRQTIAGKQAHLTAAAVRNMIAEADRFLYTSRVDFRPMKVLVADDDPVSRTLMIEILRSAQAGYEVISVEDGALAWELLQKNEDTKLAIFDLSMPGFDGIELLRRARADVRFAHLPIMVCTASTDRATVAAVAAQGVNDFIAKPFSRTVVLEKVWHLCRPSATGLPVLKDLAAARQRLDIDRDVHRELLGYYVRVSDMWATDARRAMDFSRVRSLALRAGPLRQMLASLGAAAVSAKFQEAEEILNVYRTKPVGAELPACIHKAQNLGEKIQPEIDRLREMMDTVS